MGQREREREREKKIIQTRDNNSRAKRVTDLLRPTIHIPIVPDPTNHESNPVKKNPVKNPVKASPSHVSLIEAGQPRENTTFSQWNWVKSPIEPGKNLLKPGPTRSNPVNTSHTQ